MVYIYVYSTCPRNPEPRKTNNFRCFVNTSEWRLSFKHNWETLHRSVISLHSTEKKWPHSRPLNTLPGCPFLFPLSPCHIATHRPGLWPPYGNVYFDKRTPGGKRKKCVQEYEKGCEIRITCPSYIVSRNAAKYAPNHGENQGKATRPGHQTIATVPRLKAKKYDQKSENKERQQINTKTRTGPRTWVFVHGTFRIGGYIKIIIIRCNEKVWRLSVSIALLFFIFFRLSSLGFRKG